MKQQHSLIFAANMFTAAISELLSSRDEACAVFFARPAHQSSHVRFLAVERFQLEPEDYLERTGMSAVLAAPTVFRIARHAKETKQTPVYMHTHPGSLGVPTFSSMDDEGEQELLRFLQRYLGEQPAITAVISGDSRARARLLGSEIAIEVIETGRNRQVFSDVPAASQVMRMDRQVRAFGAAGQSVIESLHIAIVGLGGTGSVTAQELAYLGGRHFTLIDDDLIDETNLNRLVGATAKDIGRRKVAVSSDLINAIQPSAQIKRVFKSVIWQDVAEQLLSCDFIFCCTDSHGSRAVLNQLAYQYFIPCIDMGASIVSDRGTVTHVVGRVQMLSPGLGCLTCGGLLDPGEVRRDLMEESERHADPYFIGVGEPQPAVVSLNSTISSLAVTMFIAAVTSLPLKARFQIYDATNGTVRVVNHQPKDGCIVCSPTGALGKAHDWELPTRKARSSCTQPASAV